MKYSLIFLIFILNACSPQNDDLKVTYLANCGYLYENNSSKVLIDPFGTEFGSFFYLPSSQTQDNIKNGNPPFNNVDLVLITHIHGDHFNPFVAQKFLQVNKKAKMICPPQVYNQMKDSCTNIEQIESQILSPQVSMNDMEKIQINDISVSAIRMQHGTDRSLDGVEYDDYTDYEKTENLGYLITFENKTIFHQGDACLNINQPALNKINQPVDIAYLSFFDWDSTSYNLLKTKLQPEHIVFMHGTKPAKELEFEEFKLIQPQLTFFKQELDSKVFN